MNRIDVTRILLLLKNISGLGSVKINNVISFFNTIDKLQNIFYVNPEELLSLGLSHVQIEQIYKPNWFFADKQLELSKRNNIEIINIYSEDYPVWLKHIYDPPVLIYVQGNKSILSAELFAIVGTRRPTIYGKKMAEFFSKELLSAGYIITSGFARGIDITAHLTTINQGQPTVVVLGTSLDYIYPSQHKKYVEHVIANNGVIISENGFTTPPHPSCFPKRNRIISGLSKGVLVVEAARKSGSLITARCAMEQAREVFAIPGNINNSQALGCLDLISQGAKLISCIDDILEELCGLGKKPFKRHFRQQDLLRPAKLTNSQHPNSYTENNLSKYNSAMNKPSYNNLENKLSSQQKLLLESLSGGVVELDTIVQNINMKISEVLSDLVQLEIMGLVASVSGGYIATGERL